MLGYNSKEELLQKSLTEDIYFNKSERAVLMRNMRQLVISLIM